MLDKSLELERVISFAYGGMPEKEAIVDRATLMTKIWNSIRKRVGGLVSAEKTA